MQDNIDQRVQLRNGLPRRFDFRRADVVDAVDDLTLQVAEVYVVVVDDSRGSYARRSEVQQCWRSQPAGTDDKNFRILKPALAQSADFRNDEMPGVPFHLGRR